jgi:pyruvate ferredoxin oxidoreductase alpha subunit
MVYVTAGCRAPVVMAVTNRALSAPINIHCDHSDAMAERDSGWIQIWAENAQETYDSVIQAFRIAEHPDLLTPVMINLDGFFLSHTLEKIQVLPDEEVRKFVGTRQFPLVTDTEGNAVPFKLDPAHPLTVGPLDMPDYYFEHKRQQEDAMHRAPKIIKEVHDEYAELTGRRYGNAFADSYRLEDAEIATVCLGSVAGTTKTVVDQLRTQGIKAGVLRIRSFRPMPIEDIQKALIDIKALAIMDRSNSVGGNGGPLFHEIRHTLYDMETRPPMVNYIYGLGGRDMPPRIIQNIYKELDEISKTGQVKKLVQFAGVRE